MDKTRRGAASGSDLESTIWTGDDEDYDSLVGQAEHTVPGSKYLICAYTVMPSQDRYQRCTRGALSFPHVQRTSLTLPCTLKPSRHRCRLTLIICDLKSSENNNRYIAFLFYQE